MLLIICPSAPVLRQHFHQQHPCCTIISITTSIIKTISSNHTAPSYPSNASSRSSKANHMITPAPRKTSDYLKSENLYMPQVKNGTKQTSYTKTYLAVHPWTASHPSS
jgi:hypothetical protein